ncbi:dihydropteroate synthase [Chlorobaculum sp. MV4-Y]|jgi:dihydropteroate synthase|uniref:dihydropteroate synthase n=1 Tax=Chlorobaculum sp. MV4-Y TaxID=2976335 RepID=UPI0021AFAED4|nr:dihydropteroate synthase [Chlorobaculum sp. MV4-Y]UWX58717.1 dihydropteroate synthase [Chlorobaculum sp. MV4-Y]
MLNLSARPAIMGIINLTPDSFFDGGTYGKAGETAQLERALESALAMVGAGADIIDVGGESTRPGSAPVSAEEEIRRTIPFIELLRRHSDVLISIDTWKSEVAAEALRAEANIVNDISGFSFDPNMPKVCAKHSCGVVLMHTPAKPDMLRWSHDTGAENEEVMLRVTRFLRHSIDIARKHGIEAIIVDPGLGFGKTVEENYRLLAQLDELHELGCPVLAGVSRKSFLGQAIRRPGQDAPPPSERLFATISANTIALLNGADILRVHDVEAAAEVRAVVLATRSASGGMA